MKALAVAIVVLFSGVSFGAFAAIKPCERQADEKKLHGAARNSFVKKCAES